MTDDPYTDGFHAGYLQAIGDVDEAMKHIGDDRTVRRCRQVLLSFANVSFFPDHVFPQPDWITSTVVRNPDQALKGKR
jgi:hypothetical protein